MAERNPAWRGDITRWAEDYASGLAEGLGHGGVAIGGSIARDQHWAHSDLEIGALVDQRDPAVTHFNVDQGRGVEIFQLERGRLESEIAQVEAGDPTPVAGWPIQLWRCRVTHDPSGLFGRFAVTFEKQLFSPAVVRLKIRQHAAAFENALAEARTWLADTRPRAALTMARAAMNERILLLHWRYGELPRSQNRTDSRFRTLARTHGLPADYELFRCVFGVDTADAAIAQAWPICRQQVLDLTGLWEGNNSRQFFTVAVDSNFTWGENGGIICVYRLYVPIVGGPDAGIIKMLDDPDWSAVNGPLLQFLGVENATVELVSSIIDRLERAGKA